VNNEKCEASRYFRNKKMEYMKDRINELARDNKKQHQIPV
jgi:hypothetical protein